MKPHDNFPNLIEAIVIICLLIGIELILGALFYDLKPLSGIDPQQVSGALTLLGNGILFSILMHYKHLSYRDLFHPGQHSAAITLGKVAIPILMLVPATLLTMSTIGLILTTLFPLSFSEQMMFERMMGNNLEALVSSCILAPVLEEMLFRGIILCSFLQQYSTHRAILLSALLFGAAHMNLYQFVIASMLGIGLGYLYTYTHSLYPSILLHAAYNSSLMLLSLQFKPEQQANWQPSVQFWIFAFIMGFIGSKLLRRLLH